MIILAQSVSITMNYSDALLENILLVYSILLTKPLEPRYMIDMTLNLFIQHILNLEIIFLSEIQFCRHSQTSCKLSKQ